ncbi:MAG: HDIG domain-containing metalloprotein [bacterium]
MALIYYLYLVTYFPIKPGVVSKINIVLAENYKEFFDEKQYLTKIEDVYKIKEYDIDYEISLKVIYNIDEFFDFQFDIKKSIKYDKDRGIIFWDQNFLKQNQKTIEYLGLNINEFEILKNVNDYEIELIRKLVMEKLEIYYKQGIDESAIPSILSDINSHLEEYIKNSRNKKFLQIYEDLVIYYLSKYVVPNKFINIQKTLEKHKQMIAGIPKAYNLSKGSVIVRKGQVIDEEIYKVILLTGTKNKYNVKFFHNSFLLGILLYLIMLLIFGFYRKDLDLYYIVSLAFILGLVLVLVTKPFYYLVPFWVAIIFAFFTGGLILTFLSFILLLFLLNLFHFQIYGNLISMDLFLLITFSFLFLLYFMVIYQKERVWVLLNRFNFNFLLWVIVFVFIVLIIFNYVGFVDNFVIYFSFLLVSIVFSLIISYFLVLLLGVGMEGIGLGRIRWLLDLNNPILSDLSQLAPGTFNHSLRVSELAEACAKAIDVNPILVKIGALYHDIGKMLRPKYFVENLILGEKNPHDEKEPYLSAYIIKSHVRDGIELANKYKLPEFIKEFIKTHHGTTIISYFFVKAKNMKDKKHSSIKEEDFRYPGPKPYTKEMAILMICDSVEAASRSLDNFSFSSLEKLAENIIERLLQDKQFSEVSLTFKELQVIKDTLIRNLYISYHTRIKYPSLKKS